MAAGADAGSRTTNSLPWPGPSLCASTDPPCSRANWRHHGQADAESPLGPVDRPVGLDEQVEDVREQLGGDAVAGVGHPDDDLARLDPRADAERAAPAGVLGGVDQQVRHHLLETDGVGVDPDRLGSDVDLEDVPALLDHRPRRLDRPGHDRPDGDPFGTEPDAAPLDPREIEQVVDQHGQVRGLSVDDLERPVEHGFAPRLAAEPDGVADRGQWVAQLVSQHGQELVRAAAAFVSGRRRTGPVGLLVEKRVTDGHEGVGRGHHESSVGPDKTLPRVGSRFDAVAIVPWTAVRPPGLRVSSRGNGR